MAENPEDRPTATQAIERMLAVSEAAEKNGFKDWAGDAGVMRMFSDAEVAGNRNGIAEVAGNRNEIAEVAGNRNGIAEMAGFMRLFDNLQHRGGRRQQQENVERRPARRNLIMEFLASNEDEPSR